MIVVEEAEVEVVGVMAATVSILVSLCLNASFDLQAPPNSLLTHKASKPIKSRVMIGDRDKPDPSLSLLSIQSFSMTGILKLY